MLLFGGEVLRTRRVICEDSLIVARYGCMRESYLSVDVVEEVKER
jgi:hypothetical protein